MDDALGQGVVVRIADTANGRVDPGFGQALGVFDRQLQGGFKRSSQRFQIGGCDDNPQTRLIDQLRAVFRQPEIVAGTWKAARAHVGDLTWHGLATA